MEELRRNFDSFIRVVLTIEASSESLAFLTEELLMLQKRIGEPVLWRDVDLAIRSGKTQEASKMVLARQNPCIDVQRKVSRVLEDVKRGYRCYATGVRDYADSLSEGLFDELPEKEIHYLCRITVKHGGHFAKLPREKWWCRQEDLSVWKDMVEGIEDMQLESSPTKFMLATGNGVDEFTLAILVVIYFNQELFTKQIKPASLEAILRDCLLRKKRFGIPWGIWFWMHTLPNPEGLSLDPKLKEIMGEYLPKLMKFIGYAV
jgi:hypothetical protein